ncbi:hypothetical protein SDC9_94818 [bioreactor metagenome]|uniref:Uncharacterized protein n=1 Tax=bioreactor metagenome TaxID=1076179 RepID=A0A645A576_9ZZZZ
MVEVQNTDHHAVDHQRHAKVLPAFRAGNVPAEKPGVPRVNLMLPTTADCPAGHRVEHVLRMGFAPFACGICKISGILNQIQRAAAVRADAPDILNADGAGFFDRLAALQLLAHLVELVHLFRSLFQRFHPGRELFVGYFQVVFGLLALGDIDARCDNIVRMPLAVQNCRERPGNEAPVAVL